MTQKSAKTGRDLSAFRAAHDDDFIVPQKIDDGLNKLGESWLYEVEFIKLCGLNTTKFAAYRDGFADFAVEVAGKRVWAGSKAFAAKLREHASR